MKTYRFPKEHLSPVMAHIGSYQITILSLSPNGDYYITELDCENLPDGEYQHLNTEYNFEEVA